MLYMSNIMINIAVENVNSKTAMELSRPPR